jgi:hypothetical protein
MIRDVILELFRQRNRPPEVQDIAEHLGLSIGEVERRLAREARLAELHDVSLEEARELLAFYGPNWLFAEELVAAIDAYFANRKRIESFERRARKRAAKPPSDGDEST